MFLKSCRFILYIIAVVCMLWACNKGGKGASVSGVDSLELNEFKKYVYDTRMKLLYEHTYDTANIIRLVQTQGAGAEILCLCG